MHRVIGSQSLLMSSFLVALLGGACSPPKSAPNGPNDPLPPSIVKAEVLVIGSNVQIVRIEVGETSESPAVYHGDELHWEVRDPSDELVAEGTIADPRTVRAEFDSSGELAAGNHYFRGDVGRFFVNIPAVDGAFILLEPVGGSWQEIGRTILSEPSSDDVGSSTHALLDPNTDVIGDPVAVVPVGDPNKRANILIVPEGYTENELETFQADVDGIVASLQLVAGFKEYWQGFNIWRQDIRSKESRIADYERGNMPDTAFSVMRGSDNAGAPWPRRCIRYRRGLDPATLGVLDRIKARVSAEYVIVLVNDGEYGGCAIPGLKTVFVTRGEINVRTLAHELGHSIFGLSDEYSAAPGSHCDPNVVGLNVSHDSSALPWSDMINTNEIPTSPRPSGVHTVGAFEGAAYCDTDVYRPQYSCLMRSGNAELCQVCAREMYRHFQRLGFVDAPIPLATIHPCRSWCCDDTEIGSEQSDPAACVYFSGEQCRLHGGPQRVHYDGQLAWEAGRDNAFECVPCRSRCCDDTVIGSEQSDPGACVHLSGEQCRPHGGPRRVFYDGQLAWEAGRDNAFECAPQPLPGFGPIQTQSTFDIGTTRHSGMWRNNEGWVRTYPVSDLTPGLASIWQGPIPLNLFPGQGDMQASVDFVLGTTLKQGFWRNNQGWARDVPIVNGVLGEAGDWVGPIPLVLLPGEGDIQAGGGIVIGDTFFQWHWQSNEGWARTVPIVNNTLGAASNWIPISSATLPGGGDVQAWSDLLVDDNTMLLQGLWRGGHAWVRKIPLVNGTLGTGLEWFNTEWIYAGSL